MRLTNEDAALPVHVLTGFLGSGKTTLLRRILADESYGDSAVLINEFGEVGLDHILVGEISPDVVLLNSGCLCCTLRGELRDALSDLLSRRTRGEIPPFRRVVIETTGLAQPSLILSTVLADPQIRHHYSIGRVVTTVDGMHAAVQAEEHDVWLEQISAADLLLVTKTDMIVPDEEEKLRARLERLNPTALITRSDSSEIATLFSGPSRHQKNKPVPDNGPDHEENSLSHPSGHGGVSTVRLTAQTPIDWEAFGVWLSMLLHAHGADILRVKGILYLSESPGPVVIQGVQHVIHPPEHLPSWEGLPVRTDLVFIMRGIRPSLLKRSFTAFVSSRGEAA